MGVELIDLVCWPNTCLICDICVQVC